MSQPIEAQPTASQPTVAILGASQNRGKYGNRSVRAHLRHGWQVFPVNPHETTVEGLAAYPTLADLPVPELDRISVYVPPEIGISLLEQIRDAKAKEVWFNPGSESDEILARCAELGIEPILACSLVDLELSSHRPPSA